jgi:hypothetical protein
VDIHTAERVQRVLLHPGLQALRTTPRFKLNGAWDAPYKKNIDKMFLR